MKMQVSSESEIHFDYQKGSIPSLYEFAGSGDPRGNFSWPCLPIGRFPPPWGSPKTCLMASAMRERLPEHMHNVSSLLAFYRPCKSSCFKGHVVSCLHFSSGKLKLCDGVSDENQSVLPVFTSSCFVNCWVFLKK